MEPSKDKLSEIIIPTSFNNILSKILENALDLKPLYNEKIIEYTVDYLNAESSNDPLNNTLILNLSYLLLRNEEFNNVSSELFTKGFINDSKQNISPLDTVAVSKTYLFNIFDVIETNNYNNSHDLNNSLDAKDKDNSFSIVREFQNTYNFNNYLSYHEFTQLLRIAVICKGKI